ncbi:MAG: zinc-binding dehydrogenase [Lachnospirales bacterium]
MKTKRAFVSEIGKISFREEETHKLGDHKVLLKVKSCGLCNWELNHWRGNIVPPQTIGHECSGIVAEIGSKVNNCKVGDRVAVLIDFIDGFSEYTVVSDCNVFKINDEIEMETFVLEPVKCVVTVTTAAAPNPGDIGVILGSGSMGLWTTQILSGNMLSALIVVDIDDNKLALAKKYGATHVLNSNKINVSEEISKISNGHMADFVIEGTGVSRLINEAMSYLKNARGRLIIMSSYEDLIKEFDTKTAVKKCIELKVAHPSFSTTPEDDARRAAELINNGQVKMEDIVTHRFKFEDIETGFKALESKKDGYLKGVVIFD